MMVVVILVVCLCEMWKTKGFQYHSLELLLVSDYANSQTC